MLPLRSRSTARSAAAEQIEQKIPILNVGLI
jgi:hypothetical protein